MIEVKKEQNTRFNRKTYIIVSVVLNVVILWALVRWIFNLVIEYASKAMISPMLGGVGKTVMELLPHWCVLIAIVAGLSLLNTVPYIVLKKKAMLEKRDLIIPQVCLSIVLVATWILALVIL